MKPIHRLRTQRRGKLKLTQRRKGAKEEGSKGLIPPSSSTWGTAPEASENYLDFPTRWIRFFLCAFASLREFKPLRLCGSLSFPRLCVVVTGNPSEQEIIRSTR